MTYLWTEVSGIPPKYTPCVGRGKAGSYVGVARRPTPRAAGVGTRSGGNGAADTTRGQALRPDSGHP